MDEKSLCLERLRRRHEVRFWIRQKEMNFKDARLFLELTVKHLRILVKDKTVPFHKPARKPRYFKQEELNVWLIRICFDPETETERQTANYFIKRRRIRL